MSREQIDMRQQTSDHTKDSPPFPVDRITWSDEDYERHHREMRNIPCVRGQEAFREITQAISWVIDYHTQHPETFWRESITTFEPRQVIMRYGGEDWSYAFHVQRRHGSTDYTEEESSVTGMAKKIVRETSHLVRKYKRMIDHAIEADERINLEEELVDAVDDVLSEMYHSHRRADPVTVQKIEGPRGPIYISQDGNHRLAAARLVGLKRVRGVVHEAQDPSIESRFWYEMLALLPPWEARHLQMIYDDVYPPDEETVRLEAEQLQRVKKELPTISDVLKQRREAREIQYQQQAEEEIRERKEVKRRYAIVDRWYSFLEDAPEFRVILHQEALKYLWEHPRGFMQKYFVREMDDRGWIKGKGDQPDWHMFGIDLDGPPRRTEDEIKFRAIKAYADLHPELKIEL